jgi:hypothetical protein
MDTKSSKTIGTTTTTTSYVGGGSTSDTVVNDSGYTDVIGSPMNHGDFHAPTAWSYLVNQSIYLNGSMRFVNPSTTTTITGVLASTSGVTTYGEAVSKAYDEATRKVFDKLYGRLGSNTDLASSAAEYYSHRVADKVTELTDETIKLRKVSTYDIADAWLKAKYKWLPICSDIFAIAAEATGTMTRKGFTLETTGSSTQGIPAAAITLQGYSFGRRPVQGQVRVDARGVWRFVVNPHLDQLARLTSLDPLVIGWNLLPYSFVVDWVYDVGGYLRDLETKARYASAFKGGFMSVRYRTSCGFSFSGQASGYPSVTATVNSQFTQKRMDRLLYGSLPSPPKPKLDFGLGSSQLFSAAALLRKALVP